jgi:hypothetical protein
MLSSITSLEVEGHLLPPFKKGQDIFIMSGFLYRKEG